jgi:hypothetical protein
MPRMSLDPSPRAPSTAGSSLRDDQSSYDAQRRINGAVSRGSSDSRDMARGQQQRDEPAGGESIRAKKIIRLLQDKVVHAVPVQATTLAAPTKMPR